MLSKILVPVDGSELSSRILVLARKLLARAGAEVTVLRVVERPPDDPSPEWTDDLARAREHLAGVVSGLAADGVEAKAEVTAGDPGEQILQATSAGGFGLVCMTTHGRSGPARWLRGSVAERVLRHATVPVLLANPGALDEGPADLGFERILVPLDGSETSAQVLPLVGEVARAYGAEVVLFTVGNFAVPEGKGEHMKVQTPGELGASLEPFVDRLRQAGAPKVELEAATGHPPTAILARAEQEGVDLVAMTTHGRSGWSRWFYGSVAESVLRACERPLLVQRVAKR